MLLSVLSFCGPLFGEFVDSSSIAIWIEAQTKALESGLWRYRRPVQSTTSDGQTVEKNNGALANDPGTPRRHFWQDKIRQMTADKSTKSARTVLAMRVKGKPATAKGCRCCRSSRLSCVFISGNERSLPDEGPESGITVSMWGIFCVERFTVRAGRHSLVDVDGVLCCKHLDFRFSFAAKFHSENRMG